MYRIIDSDCANDYLCSQNEQKPEISTKQLQIHISFGCGCLITVDKLGEYVIQCNKHNVHMHEFQKGGKLAR